MSTILKSLKKLEQEKRGIPSDSPFSSYRGPGSLASQGVKERWYKNVWLKRGLVAGVIFVLGAASLYFYSQSREVDKLQASLENQARSRTESRPKKNVTRKPRRTPPPEADESATGIKNNAPRPVPSQMNKTPGPQRMTSTPPTSQSTAPPLVSNTPEEGSTGVATPSRRPKVREDKNIAPQPTRPKAPVRAKPPPAVAQPSATRSTKTDRVSPKAKEKPPRKPAPESFDNVPVLSGGPLKVHAIVWSTVSEDRMAVVNSKVLHEGDDVDGYTLVAIRPDDVVVKKGGGGRYRVLFGRP